MLIIGRGRKAPFRALSDGLGSLYHSESRLSVHRAVPVEIRRPITECFIGVEMKAECYELHIYCDAASCRQRGEYTGANKREAHKNAWRDGWIIGPKDYCSDKCKYTLE